VSHPLGPIIDAEVDFVILQVMDKIPHLKTINFEDINEIVVHKFMAVGWSVTGALQCVGLGFKDPSELPLQALIQICRAEEKLGTHPVSARRAEDKVK